jgi:serine protease Do
VVKEVEVGEGSGFVVASDATASWVLTNAHVVVQTDRDQDFVQGADGRPVTYEKVRVALNDGREVEASFAGIYLEADLALLKVALPNLPAVEWGDSERVQVGDWVVALGFPLGVGYSATSGIVSATDRVTGDGMSGRFDSHIQTDAAINPGNSGGPLVDMQGRVVGINASIASKTGANIGIGFAIPANLGRRIAEELRLHGKVRRPVIGVLVDHLTADQAKALGMSQTQGLRLTGVVPEGPAARAGLQAGDVVLAIGGNKVVTMQQFQARLASLRLEDTVVLRVWRAGEERDLSMKPVGEDDLERQLADLARVSAQLRGVHVREFGLWLGNDDQPGLRVSAVDEGGIADQAGIKPGDRLLHERSLGPLRTQDDAASFAKLRDAVVQVYSDGHSVLKRLRR